MNRSFRFDRNIGLCIVALAVFLFSQAQIARLYQPPFPRFDMLLTKNSGFQDAAFIVSGFRSVAADVAWVQLLQNMGDYGNAEEKGMKYPYLKGDTLRVARIDPYFKRAYLFGAATLAYLQTTNRPQEALEVLNEGIRFNPKYWPFHTFVTGIGYKQSNQFEKMIEMLETSIADPECPTMVKAILANAYKLHRRYPEALALWKIILKDENGRDYHQKAKEEIVRLEKFIATQ
ncbi:MAG: hypothetical protein KCHDKBKB_02535 [Elusimicrobia bacterium]|nr:hypothetical protein [Elusimicrobiota bacterium]